jgi:hypothetical protein
LKDQIADLKGRILPIKDLVQRVAATHTVQDDIVDYLEVKAQLLLSYCTNVVFYLYMKAQGRSVANHPVMKQLLKLRYVMEKMRPLDGKLKHQIDRLVQLSEMSAKDLSQHQHTDLLRPNPSALLAEGGDGKSKSRKSAGKKASKHHSSDEEEDSLDESDISDDMAGSADEDAGAEKAGVYKVPKRTAVPYKDSENALERREQKIEKQRAKIKRSELMDALREEFGSAPEAAASSGLGMQSGDLRKLQEEADERREFEEDRFVRLVCIIAFLCTCALLTRCCVCVLSGADDEPEGQEVEQATRRRGLQVGQLRRYRRHRRLRRNVEAGLHRRRHRKRPRWQQPRRCGGQAGFCRKRVGAGARGACPGGWRERWCGSWRLQESQYACDGRGNGRGRQRRG